MPEPDERWSFSIRTRADTVSMRIVVPSESVHKPEEPIDLKGREARDAFQLFAQGYVEGAVERAVAQRMAQPEVSKNPYNAGYSDGWNKCQDQLKDVYRQLAEAQARNRRLGELADGKRGELVELCSRLTARAAERDDECIALEKKCAEWLALASRAHDQLGYPTHGNVERATDDIDQVRLELRAVVEHDNESVEAGEDWSDEEIDKRIEAKLALWAWRFARGIRPHSREGLLAHEALQCRAKLKQLLEKTP